VIFNRQILWVTWGRAVEKGAELETRCDSAVRKRADEQLLVECFTGERV
jgi:hypothetical protein